MNATRCCAMCETWTNEQVPDHEVWGCSFCGRVVYPVIAPETLDQDA